VIIQQVNLFQPIFRKERKLLSFRVLWQGCAAALVVLMLMYGWGVRQTLQMQSELAKREAQQQMFVAQLNKVSARLAGMKTDTGPQLELSNLERELLARQKVVNALTQVRETYTRGISAYLESFSRQAPKGVWLTGFSVQAGGEGLVIRGSSLKPELVPTFLRQLSSENTLAGTRFGLLQIQRESADARFVDFTVTTGTEQPEASSLLEPTP
jgi:Tfp pilus assembly protein PilN